MMSLQQKKTTSAFSMLKSNPSHDEDRKRAKNVETTILHESIVEWNQVQVNEC